MENTVVVTVRVRTSGPPSRIIQELERVLSHSFGENAEIEVVNFTR